MRLREEMSDMLIHDLRNPLGVIKTGLDLLARVQVVESDSEYSAHVIQTIEKSTKRMQRLVDTLLDIARLEKGAMALSMGPMDLGALVEDTMADLSPLAERGDVTLDSRLPEDLPLALADQDVVERVLVNLMDNALKFTPPDGQVWVEARAEGENVQVDVVDTGNTLKANGLQPLEHIADISSRLVVNKASMKRKHARVQAFIDQLAEAVRKQQDQAA